MTLTFTQGHRIGRKLELVQSLTCKVAEVIQMFAMAEHVKEMTANGSCKYSEFGALVHLLFLFTKSVSRVHFIQY